MNSAILNVGAGIVIALILSTGYNVLDKMNKVAQLNQQANKSEQVVIGHRVDSTGTFQLVYKTN